MPAIEPAPLRFTTWLAPGLPLGLFDTIADRVSAGLGRPYELTTEPKISGPMSTADDRFATGLTDIGFICPPSYLWLTAGPNPGVRLVPLAPIYDDPRNGGRPAYLSDIVVRADDPAASFADLAGRRVGFNERASLSGFVSLLAKLDQEGLDVGFFGQLRQVGSHRRALELIEAGEIDAAAIDANVLSTWRGERDDGGAIVRSIDVLGPYPVQPVVVRAGADPGVVDAVAEQVASPALAEAVRPFGVTGF
ncbi:MAG: PhnD/SsuA/transferrin family substrate-binding protein, partial [Actinomycetota bacterium]